MSINSVDRGQRANHYSTPPAKSLNVDMCMLSGYHYVDGGEEGEDQQVKFKEFLSQLINKLSHVSTPYVFVSLFFYNQFTLFILPIRRIFTGLVLLLLSLHSASVYNVISRLLCPGH